MSFGNSSVYFIRAGDTGAYKIGRAVDPTKRLKELQTGNHAELQLIFSRQETDNITESYLHHVFDKVRLVGEWFAPVDEVLLAIESLKEHDEIVALDVLRTIEERIEKTSRVAELSGISTAEALTRLKYLKVGFLPITTETIIRLRKRESRDAVACITAIAKKGLSRNRIHVFTCWAEDYSREKQTPAIRSWFEPLFLGICESIFSLSGTEDGFFPGITNSTNTFLGRLCEYWHSEFISRINNSIPNIVEVANDDAEEFGYLEASIKAALLAQVEPEKPARILARGFAANIMNDFFEFSLNFASEFITKQRSAA